MSENANSNRGKLTLLGQEGLHGGDVLALPEAHLNVAVRLVLAHCPWMLRRSADWLWLHSTSMSGLRWLFRVPCGRFPPV